MQSYNNLIKNENHWNRFMKNSQIMGYTRSIEWIKKLISTDKVRNVIFNDEEGIESFCNCLESYMNVLEARHPGKWDIVFTSEYTEASIFDLIFVIHYPRLNITNSENKTHIIKDLIVQLEMQWNSDLMTLSVENVRGFRTTISDKEMSSGYVHSHLSSNAMLHNPNGCMQSISFCLGDSSEIEDTKTLLENHNDVNIFEMFILNLDSMVAWESLEGVPYIRMTQIGKGDAGKAPDKDICINVYDKIFPLIFNSRKIKLNYILNENRFAVKRDQVLHDHLKDVIITLPLNILRRCLQVVNASGNIRYYSKGNYSINAPKFNKDYVEYNEDTIPYTVVRGRKLYFKVERTSDDGFEPYKVSPIIIDYVAQELEQVLYKKAVRRSSIKRADRLSTV